MLWKILGVAVAILIVVALLGPIVKAIVGLAVIGLVVIGVLTVAKWFGPSKATNNTPV